MVPACRMISKGLLPSLLPGPQNPFTPCPHLFRLYFWHFISQAADIWQNRNLGALEGLAGTGQGEKPERHNSLVLSSSVHYANFLKHQSRFQCPEFSQNSSCGNLPSL